MGIRLCSIGCGYMANDGHGPAYARCAAEDRDITLEACCDVDSQRAEVFRARFGFRKAYTDYREMLDAERPDAVALLVPPNLTARMAVEVISMGCALMMEKPPGLDGTEARAISEAAERAGALNQVALNRRHIPLLRRLMEMLAADGPASRGLGADGRPQVGCAQPIQNIRYDFYRAGRRDPDFSTTAIHGIDAVSFIARSPYQEVRFDYQELGGAGPGVANVFMSCVMQSGATAQLAFCPLTGITLERAVVHLEGSTFLLELPIWRGHDCPGRLTHVAGNRLLYSATGAEVTDGPAMFEESGFYHENKTFFSDVRAGRMPHDNITTAVQAVEIADCIRRRDAAYSAGP